jgi:hypothetical protein
MTQYKEKNGSNTNTLHLCRLLSPMKHHGGSATFLHFQYFYMDVLIKEQDVHLESVKCICIATNLLVWSHCYIQKLSFQSLKSNFPVIKFPNALGSSDL